MATSSETLPTTTTAAERRRRVSALALPAVGEQVLNTLVGMVDIFLLGHLSATAAATLGYGSSAALAGAGLAHQLIWLVMVFFMAVGVGTTALVSRSRGANDMASASQALRQSLLIAFLLGSFTSVVAWVLAAPALGALGAASDVLPLGASFLQINATTFTLTALLLVGTAALRGAGDTRTPLYVMLMVNAVNIALSWLLINGNLGAPALGVVGAGIGAAVARGLGGLVLVGVLLRGRSGLELKLDLRPDWELLRRIVRVGAPSGAEQLVFQGALLIFVTFVLSLGTAAYAAHNVVINIESLSFLPGMGYAMAASALVGQQLGARNPDEAAASAYEALLQGGLMMTLLGVVMVLFPTQLLQVFVADPAVIALGEWPMRIAGLFQPPLAANFIISGALRGAGDTRWPLYTKLISTWGIRLPLVMLLGWLGFGLTGIWVAMGTDFLVQSLLAYWRFRGGRWRQIKV